MIKPMYDSILKHNDKSQMIRRKTHNLTQSRAQIDPIDCQIKGFSFRDFEAKIWHLIGNFSSFFRQNLDFRHSLDMEMSLEDEAIKRFKD